MLDASNAVENQKVSICRLSSENRAVIIKAIDITIGQSQAYNSFTLTTALQELNKLIKESKEIWLIE